MKKFTKLALATSVAFSANAMAMQAMDDASLSATTGQDGLSIGIGISKIEIEKLFIHDNDGLDKYLVGGNPAQPADGTNPAVPEKLGNLGGTNTAGAIVIYGNGLDVDSGQKDQSNNPIMVAHKNKTHGVVIGANYDDDGAYLLASRNLADLTIDSDAGDGNPFINIAAKVSGLDISIGKIGVTASGVQGAGTNANTIRRGGGTVVNEILSGLEIKTGVLNANIQLGAAPQGAMIALDTKMIGGLEIKNLGIVDNSTTGYEFTKVDVPVVNPDTGLPVLDGDNNPTFVRDVPVTTREAGEIFIESIKVADANSKDLTLKQNISVYNNAYVGPTPSTRNGKPAHVRIVSLDTGAKDQYIKGIHLGNRTAASIGDMEVQGLQTWYSPKQGEYVKGAVITISGH